jgi:hypothetical protein
MSPCINHSSKGGSYTCAMIHAGKNVQFELGLVKMRTYDDLRKTTHCKTFALFSATSSSNRYYYELDFPEFSSANYNYYKSNTWYIYGYTCTMHLLVDLLQNT